MKDRALRRFLKVALLGLAAAAIALVLYESFAVFRARQATPAVLRAAAEGELALSDVSAGYIAVLLKVDDPGFYQHRGVDFSTPGQGMTSITQSLVKRFYFDDFQPGFAKIEQSLIARFVLDPAMTKDAQLAAYINNSHFGWRHGRPIVGFANAARAYYGRDLRNLDGDQYLSLVAMLMAPKTYDPIRQPRANAERVRRIRAMLSGRCSPTGLRDVTYDTCG